MHLKRTLNLPGLLQKKSFFLFGPRATGKSTLIHDSFKPNEIILINLLRSDYYLMLNNAPHTLEDIIQGQPGCQLVVIDEVQRVPELLNEVHRLIEELKLTFLLTGSSARTLKKQGINLLAGRAWQAHLFPLTSEEIPSFDLNRYLRYGGLPAVYLSDYPEEELNAYVHTYLREEIQAESLIRKIPAFTRFLQAAALSSGQMLNFSEISSDTGIPVSTIREYYHVLEDTFIGFMVPGWTKSVKRKAIAKAKFYLFDIGVRNALAQISDIPPKTDVFGQSFEHFIALEIRAWLDYSRINKQLSYWCSTHGAEVDFIIGDDIAVEVKSTDKIHDKHLKNLYLLEEEGICKKYFIISFDKINRKKEAINIIYWKDFLQRLWHNDI
ncbi:ATP-binding protein [Legionella spiritensis]|uniref:ATP-binding protein n=1 Tax=Legionella spiritensis TaxID=452 RepID=UPI000F6BE907|nr:ATP-binding protein [Legionella spiritensis]VEG90960.1 ATPase [Legionella spiritensis]